MPRPRTSLQSCFHPEPCWPTEPEAAMAAQPSTSLFPQVWTVANTIFEAATRHRLLMPQAERMDPMLDDKYCANKSKAQ
eukprot:12918053-Prorocentrum_lima.AAC.1